MGKLKMKAMSFILCIFFLGAMVSQVQAISIKITKVSGSGTDIFEDIQKDLDEALEGVTEDPRKFYGYLANSGAIASRGVSVDYADTTFKYVNLGFLTSMGVTPATNLSKLMGGDPQLMGFAVVPSVSLGLDMHYVPVPILKDFKFFINFFYIDAAKMTSGAAKKVEMVSFGLHFLYPVVKPISVKSPNLLLWGGVNVSGGLDYVANEIHIPYAITSQGVTVEPVARMVNKVFTLPIEVSTNARFLYFLTLFVGFGADFNFGSSYVDIDKELVASNGNVYRVDADLGKSRMPHFMTLRLFTGLQLNIWAFHIFTKLDYSFTSNSLAMQGGFRFSY